MPELLIDFITSIGDMRPRQAGPSGVGSKDANTSRGWRSSPIGTTSWLMGAIPYRLMRYSPPRNLWRQEPEPAGSGG